MAASAILSKTPAFSMIETPPAAIGSAAGFGQPSRGATRRRSLRPQFIIARAAAPIFSPSCGRTRMMTGGCADIRQAAVAGPEMPSRCSFHIMPSPSATTEASMMLVDTPTVRHMVPSGVRNSIITRVTAPVPDCPHGHRECAPCSQRVPHPRAWDRLSTGLYEAPYRRR